jgi:hypothetical protein
VTVRLNSAAGIPPACGERGNGEAASEHLTFSGAVIPIRQAAQALGEKLSLERLHQIDRVFFGPFFRDKYGTGGDRALENGRIRYYGPVQRATGAGEFAGRRYVHEFDTMTGCLRGWHETVDWAGNVRQVRPELSDGSVRHYQFDGNGRYRGSW